MMQGVGYVAAAMGPLAFGILHEDADGWDAIAVFFSMVMIVTLIAAIGAGRNLYRCPTRTVGLI
jgi:CP family cyanate transporter-like MFS transporter